MRMPRAAIGITVAASLVAGSTSGWASPEIRPRWAFEQLHANPNETFLSNQDFRIKSDNPLERLLDPAQKREMRLRYEQMSRKYETARNYGLYTTTHEQAEMDEVNSYRDDLRSSVQSYQIRQGTEKAKDAALADENISKFKGPIALILGLVAVYNGAPVNMKVAPETHLQAKTDKGKSAQFNVSSPVVNSSFEMASSAPTSTTAFDELPKDPSNRPERYKFGLSRELGMLDLTTSVTYGSTTDSVMSSLAKPLLPNTTCYLDEIQPLAPGSSNVREPEVRVRLAYGLNF
jgi:hypothetical protein